MCLSLSRSTPNTYITYKKGAVLWENVTPLLAVILTVLAALFPPLSKTCHGPALVSPSSVLRLFHQPQSGLFSKGLFISYIPQFFVFLACCDCNDHCSLVLKLPSAVTSSPPYPEKLCHHATSNAADLSPHLPQDISLHTHTSFSLPAHPFKPVSLSASLSKTQCHQNGISVDLFLFYFFCQMRHFRCIISNCPLQLKQPANLQ